MTVLLYSENALMLIEVLSIHGVWNLKVYWQLSYN